MKEWILVNQINLWWLSLISFAMFIGTLFLLPILVARIPEDYFVCKKRHTIRWKKYHPFVRLLIITGKNLLGIIFILSGIAMLFLPGQGIITILIGITLTNFPGKFKLERWIIKQPTVIRTVNWLRAKANRPALQIVQDSFHKPKKCTLTTEVPE